MTEHKERGFLGWTLIFLQAILVLVLLGILIPFVSRSLRGFPAEDTVRTRSLRYQTIAIRDALRNDRGIFRMQEYFPEGGCFTVTLYSLAWCQLLERSQDAALRDMGLDELRWALGEFGKLHVTAPFTDAQVRRGVFWLGQRNLVLGRYLSLLPEPGRESRWVDEFHQNSSELHEAFLRSPTHHLDSYTGHTWPADNMAALLSLHLHDRLYQTEFRDAYDAWKSWTLEHLDPATELPAASLDRVTGELKESARGSSCAWMLSLLPEMDPDFAKILYERFEKHFEVNRLGFRMFREFPVSSQGVADVDSGPLIFGVGTTATGVGLAAALANGDIDTAIDIHSLAEMWGVPRKTEFDGRPGRRYLFGRLPVADAFLALGYGNPRARVTRDQIPSAGELMRRRAPFYAVCSTAVVLLMVYAVLLLRACRRPRDPWA